MSKKHTTAMPMGRLLPWHAMLIIVVHTSRNSRRRRTRVVHADSVQHASLFIAALPSAIFGGRFTSGICCNGVSDQALLIMIAPCPNIRDVSKHADIHPQIALVMVSIKL